uniref:DUF3558 family protein n=1 Tax=Millisia brevis TaxID=264148 RepID=UPI0012EDD7A2
MNNRRMTLGTALAVSVLAGCTTSTMPDTTITNQAETSTMVTTPTEEPLPDVTFDPCTQIDDAILLRFGLESADRDPGVTTIGRETMVGCGMLGDERSASVVAQNTPWEQIPFLVTPYAVTVNGREAWYVPGGTDDRSCSVLIRTSFGAVIVNSTPSMGRR